jgi:hypothetical protein
MRPEDAATSADRQLDQDGPPSRTNAGEDKGIQGNERGMH